jgi:hypothetical protein
VRGGGGRWPGEAAAQGGAAARLRSRSGGGAPMRGSELGCGGQRSQARSGPKQADLGHGMRRVDLHV